MSISQKYPEAWDFYNDRPGKENPMSNKDMTSLRSSQENLPSEHRPGIAMVDCIAVNTQQMVTLEAHEALVEQLRDAWAERNRLREQNKELLTVVKIAYTILGDIQHQWEGRHTAEGQGALSGMRDAIAKATGQDPRAVQDDYCTC